MEVWVPFAAGVLGAVLALIGGIVSPMLTSKRDHKAWVRDKLMERGDAYLALTQLAEDNIAAVNQFWREDDALMQVGDTSTSSSRAVDIGRLNSESEALVKRLHSGAQNLRLFGSETLTDNAHEIAIRFRLFVGQRTTYNAGGIENLVASAVVTFKKQLRRELRID